MRGNYYNLLGAGRASAKSGCPELMWNFVYTHYEIWRESPGWKKPKQVNDKTLGKQLLWTKIKDTAFVHFRREMMEMECSKSSYT